ncbi:MAG TPA: carbohydrate ABC transporter permease [Thermomicrobiales bacterium]|jgi:multiple sugar transport system permease protein|nr:carbohydrate ABC transporter permease [Thermomicrobiales bacterium]
MATPSSFDTNRYQRSREDTRDIVVDRIIRFLAYLVLILVTIVTIGPFYFSVVLSLLPQPQTVRLDLWSFIPNSDWQIDAYLDVFRASDLPLWFLNSSIVALIWVAARCLFDTMAGYAFARMNFPGKDLAFLVILSTLMIPGMVTLIPKFIILNEMGLLNTYGALTVPFLADAFGIFLMRQFFMNFPVDLEDAARIDGASRWRMFFHIALPNAGAALTTLVIFSFQGSWNNFLEPLIYISDASLRTLPIGLAFFRRENVVDYPLQMSVAIVSIIPIVIVFFVFQRYFLESNASSGIKG